MNSIPKFVADNIIDKMFDSLVLLDIKKNIISINKAAIRLFGYSNDELRGKSLRVFIKNKLEYNLLLEEINVNNEFNNIESLFRTKKGIDVKVLISSSIIENNKGISEVIICNIKDITDLERNEMIKDVLLSISDASRKIKSLAELSKIVHKQISLLMDAENFYIALIHDKEQGTYTFPYIVDINPNEYIAPDIPWKLKRSATHYVFKNKKILLLRNTVGEELYRELDIDLIGVDCKTWVGIPLKVTEDEIIGVMVLQSYSDIDKYSNEDVNILSIISNTIASVIKHWQTDEILIQLEKMEVVGKLAGGVAHDLNNVLGAIVSYPDLILKKLPSDSPLKKIVLTMQQSGLKAAAIVQDLLTLARRGVAINTIENLNDIIIDYIESPVFDKLKRYHPNVKIYTKLEKNIPYIKGSFLHLSKTIMNLVSNAAESITTEGKITISTELKLLQNEKKGYYQIVKSGEYVVLKISDTGIGIAKSDLNKIFEPFYTKKKMGRSGTGLGMAVVWGTIEDHKGFIDVKSIEGEGTLFEIYFPITKKTKAEKSNEISMVEYTGSGEVILIIDDEKNQREIAMALLSELGYAVYSVSTGEEALLFLKKHKIDLCIIDMIMDPGIDGLDTYKLLKKFKPDIKVVIASGYSESNRVKKALKLGANSYVQKPYTIEKIGMSIKRVLRVRV